MTSQEPKGRQHISIWDLLKNRPPLLANAVPKRKHTHDSESDDEMYNPKPWKHCKSASKIASQTNLPQLLIPSLDDFDERNSVVYTQVIEMSC